MFHPNLPTETGLTVSELTREIKNLLEQAYPVVRVRGEISNLRRQPSGHQYFSLKDAGASIACVCFRGDAARLKVRLADGLQVIGTGRISVYEPRGNYQIILRAIEEDGVGRLQQAFLALKEKLAAEGLFDRERKQALPALPERIGFVTSPSGAALQDFVSILRRRDWRGRLVVIPARVQGREAAPEIVRGIEQANRHGLCDLLVVGRGGGSLEDLWPFNEEQVARAVAASAIPVISAVGHETDFTLSDFAADHRAETPSSAAEWITSSRQALLERWSQLRQQLLSNTQTQLERRQHRFALLQTQLQRHHPRQRLEQAAMRLDDLQGRLGLGILQVLKERGQQLRWLRARFASLHPEKRLALCRQTLRQVRLRLEAGSHQSALLRGFAVVRSPQGAVISDAASVAPGSLFAVEMRDASFQARRESAGDVTDA